MSQGDVDARWGVVVVVVVVIVVVGVVVCCLMLLSSSPQGGTFWSNRAEAHGQLVLSPVKLPEQLRRSR